MPPSLDLYALCPNRNEEMINAFIDEYVDRERSEDRGDEELMLDPLDVNDGSTQKLTDYDWEPALTLSHIIHRGLDHPRRSFTVYLAPKQAEIEQAIIRFTQDDQVIFGLSIDDAGMKHENLQTARNLLTQLCTELKCTMGVIRVDNPPPDDESEFRALIASGTECWSIRHNINFDCLN